MKASIFLKSEAVSPATSAYERTLSERFPPGGARTGSRPQQPAPAPKPSSRRSKIWELTAMLHCSIVGTCVTTGELRALLRKFDATIDPKATDHELHTVAVAAVGGNNETAKQIQKTLDQRHKLAIGRFATAQTNDALQQRWGEAARGGDIPGAYWALLTHPLATEELARHAFGDVHMLSHLVGAANRADIHRLRELEEQKAELEAKLARQQLQLRDGIMAREAKIRELSTALSARIEREHAGMPDGADRGSELPALDVLVADLRKQLDIEIRRRERAEKKAQESAAMHAAEDAARTATERELASLRDELDAAEGALAAMSGDDDHDTDKWDLAGLTILYVGGRSRQVSRIKTLVQRANGELLHHDGGIEERPELLAALVARADIAACPIDCVSHTAALVVKRLCRQAGKTFLPLRSSGIASLMRAIGSAQARATSRAA